MRRHTGFLFIVTALLGSSFSARPAIAKPKPLPLRFVACGEVLTSVTSFRLGNDMHCPTGAFTITSGTNAIVDLAGHIVHGNGAGSAVGILIGAGASNITVRNGVISNWNGIGLSVNSSDDNVVSGATFVNDNISVRVVGSRNRVLDSTMSRADAVLVSGGSTTDNNTFENNVLEASELLVNGADNNTVRTNSFFGPTPGSAAIELDAVAADGAQGNTIDSNNIFGQSGSGISVQGTGSNGNQIENNTIKGADISGINVNEGTGTTVDANRVEGGAGAGIALGAGSTGDVISNNVVSGNAGDGISLQASATGAQITSNTVTNNGGNGIVNASGAAPKFSANTADFNGFRNGLVNNDNFGIKSPDGSLASGGTTSEANGNDVTVAATQCDLAALCSVPSSPVDQPPTLTTCGASGSVVLDNPLACSTAGGALQPGANGLTLDLGTMSISGGAAEPALGISSPVDGLTVTGGVFVDGGIVADQLSHATFSKILIANANSGGITLVSSHDNTFTGGVVVGSAADGVFLSDGDANSFKSLVIAGNGTSVGNGVTVFPGSSGNVFVGDVVDANVNGDGFNIEDADHNAVKGSTIVGNAGAGVRLRVGTVGAKSNKIKTSVIRGNDSFGVELEGDAAANGLGDAANKIAKNTIAANVGDGVSIEDDPDAINNVISDNKVLANYGGFGGIAIQNEVRKTLIVDNVVSNNAQDGVYFGEPEAGKVIDNRANRNGFVAINASPVSDQISLGFDDTRGCGNHAKHNDDPEQAFPKNVLQPC